MRLRRKAALVAPALAVLMVAAACGGGDDDDSNSGGNNASEGKQGGTMIYGLDTEFPENFQPFISSGNSVATAYMQIRIFPAPWAVQPDFTLKYDDELLSAEPTSEVVGGKQVLTYKIKPEAVWSDGTPITYKDFKYTQEINSNADPATGGCAAIINTAGYEQVESVEGSDNDKTVKVTFEKPFADWKSLFIGPGIQPAHLMDKGDPKANCDLVTKGWPTQNGFPNDISGGPFQILKSNIDLSKKTAVLTPNPKYWGTKPKLDRLVFQYIGNEPSTTVKALQSGEVHIVYPQPQLDLVKNIEGLAPKIKSETEFGLSFEHFDMNVTRPFLKDLAVRKAIALGLDRPALVKSTVAQFDNRAQILNNRFYTNGQPEYKDTSGGLYDKPDVAAAQKALEDGGYTKGPDGIYQKDGKKIELTIMTTAGNPLRSDTIDLAQKQLKEVGISIKKFENEDIFEGPEKPTSMASGNFDIALFAWVSSPFATPNIPIYRSPKSADSFGQNYSRGGDPEVDKALTGLSEASDPAKATEFANQADTQLWKDLFTIPLYQKPVFLAYDTNYINVINNATNAGPLWNAEKIALKQ